MPKGKPDGEVRRWKCTCAYDGTEYAGWQKQPSGLAVQDKIEESLKEIFEFKFVRLDRDEPMPVSMPKLRFFILTLHGPIRRTHYSERCGSIFPLTFLHLKWKR